MSTPFVALVSSYLIQQLNSRTLPPWEAISTVTLHTDSLPQAGTGNDIGQHGTHSGAKQRANPSRTNHTKVFVAKQSGGDRF